MQTKLKTSKTAEVANAVKLATLQSNNREAEVTAHAQKTQINLKAAKEKTRHAANLKDRREKKKMGDKRKCAEETIANMVNFWHSRDS